MKMAIDKQLTICAPGTLQASLIDSYKDAKFEFI
eukprot:CAMPEP_0197829354 /NCGR_PEP_ID=MMETSP1437-20131217/5789_1 /TAXON_ID=49252 ORGANISM="Eucampia antarctica, Strain CCMP1452" /NCGR_SAMPLE_ID=MMETSP1437 /ASSEMBLY_ACC=CAM_ASM_001096 /LENGTH=33 /DNA_ID= /DNA_START= /DNA_END= /DNA_ORIENTATION=